MATKFIANVETPPVVVGTEGGMMVGAATTVAGVAELWNAVTAN